MNPVTVLFIALGLAMDAFAVSIVAGSVYRQLRVRHALRMALFFGAFQAAMPLIGSLAGLGLKTYISPYDHWIAFGLLAFVGGKMIYEAFAIESAEKNLDPSNLMVLLALSIATSIDALAVGVTLSLLTRSVAFAVVVIGLITFGLSYVGVVIGKRFGHFCESRIEVLGGLVLIAIGVRILLAHLL
ncbi:MAG: manganese efflux pump MntP family protein [Sedimentisphaerales bacterium]|jgi:putative Mn2+ efflux pump MntP|nr:manganese efflux pump MntP family protein [Sedimentisphaerales bacterium]NLT75379.1 manganese efflux pump [Planctomycetota bacterium]